MTWDIGLQTVRQSPVYRLGECLGGTFDDTNDWLEILITANSHLVGPHLYRSLCASEYVDRADPELLTYLADLDAANKERNERLLAQLAEVAALLGGEGLDPLVIKGGAMLVRAGDVATTSRMLHDIDILIDSESSDIADRALRDRGLEPNAGSRGQHSLGSYSRPDFVGTIDVHWRLPERFRSLVTPEDLRMRTRTVELGITAIRIPDSSLQLVINIAHELIHDRGVLKGFLDLRYLLEIVELCEYEDDPIDWDWVSDKCGIQEFRMALELQSRMIAQLFGKSPIPLAIRSKRGRLLHQRRLLKLRYENLGILEWQILAQIRDLRKRLGLVRSSPTARG